MADLVYKIFRLDEWESLQASGSFAGSPDDLRDGFIHLSSKDQVAGTAEKHFGGEANLVLAAVDTDVLGKDLAWDVSGDGARFPHFYGKIAIDSVAWAAPYLLGSDGERVMPEELG